MRVASYKFLAKTVYNRFHIEIVLFLSYLGIENDMQEQIAEFFFYVIDIIIFYCLCKLIHLLDGIGLQGKIRLFSVPRAFFPQRIHYFQQLGKGSQCLLVFFLHNAILFVYFPRPTKHLLWLQSAKYFVVAYI